MSSLINVDQSSEVARLRNDDQVGYLFSECMRKLAAREVPSDDEIEAANIELANLGVQLCRPKT